MTRTLWRRQRTAALAVLVVIAGCGTSRGMSEQVAAVPGPTLEGRDVVHFPLDTSGFTDPRKYVTQGQRGPDGSCAYVAEGVIDPTRPDVQEVVVAEDPGTCRFLVVGGEVARRRP